ncbi:MAG: DUF3052 family protein [Rhodobiaceae bacterium]|nr:DUF3052 family protein [Rhodobiaceae bacterium]MCC0048364.1 DUF3052 family protein [Rhodobiaceae bacterium]
MAGYSSTPLVKKLGMKPGFKILLKNPPDNYAELTGAFPADVRFHEPPAADLDMVHLFTKSREELARELTSMKAMIKPAGMIWVSWPKKASKVPTDVTEDEIRSVCLPMGLVDVKVCAVDEIWSGLKLMIRKSERAT